MLDFVSGELNKSSELIAKLVADKAMQQTLVDISKKIEATLRANGKVLLAGNGGSAADAQHIAGEFVSRFNYDRPGLSANGHVNFDRHWQRLRLRQIVLASNSSARARGRCVHCHFHFW
jgi:phosphoheptose isomerase